MGMSERRTSMTSSVVKAVPSWMTLRVSSTEESFSEERLLIARIQTAETTFDNVVICCSSKRASLE